MVDSVEQFVSEFLGNTSNSGLLGLIVKDEGANNNIRFSPKLVQSVRVCFDWDEDEFSDIDIYEILEEICSLDPRFRVKELEGGGKVFQYREEVPEKEPEPEKISELPKERLSI